MLKEKFDGTEILNLNRKNRIRIRTKHLDLDPQPWKIYVELYDICWQSTEMNCSKWDERCRNRSPTSPDNLLGELHSSDFVRRTRTNCQIGQQINIQTDNCRQTNTQTNRQKYKQQKSRQRLQHNNNQIQGGDISGKNRSNIREIY